MFDIGWMEMLVIGTVALVFVGPKELPGMFRTLGQFAAKARAMARDFQRSMEQAANEAGLGEASKMMSSLNRTGLGQATNAARDYAKSMALGEGKPKVAVTQPGGVVAPDVVVAAASEQKTAPKRKPTKRADPLKAPRKKPGKT